MNLCHHKKYKIHPDFKAICIENNVIQLNFIVLWNLQKNRTD